MSEGAIDMPMKLSGDRTMRDLCIAVASPRPLEPQKVWFARGARRADISLRQFQAIFRGEITDPEHRSVRRLEAAERQRSIEEATRADTQRSIDRMVALRAALASIDPEFYRGEIERLDRALGAMRGDHRPVGRAVRAVALPPSD
jgi:hypothetical protein